jgi:hypothetical protein
MAKEKLEFQNRCSDLTTQNRQLTEQVRSAICGSRANN